MLAALAVCALLGADFAAVLGEVCAFLAFVSLGIWLILRKRPLGKFGLRVVSLTMCVVLACSSLGAARYVSAYRRQMEPAQQLDGRTVRITARVTDTPVSQYHRYYYLLNVEQVTENEETLSIQQFTMRVSSRHQIDCQPYDTLLCTVKCSAFEADGLYSTRSSRFADGVALSGYIVEEDTLYPVKGLGTSFAEFAVSVRELISQKLRAALPERAYGLVQAMLLGRKDCLDSTDEWNFRKVGAAHLLVISGLHMTVVAAVLCFPFRFLRDERLRALLSSAVIFLFLCVTGFPPAAQRSALMCVVTFVGAAIGRRADSLNSLGFAVLVICVQNPFSGGDLGFTLSVVSTLGILCLSGPINRTLNTPLFTHPVCRELLSPAFSSLSVTLAALVATMPIQISVFGGISLLSPLVNLVLVIPCTAVLYLALPAAVLALIPTSTTWLTPLFRLLRLACELSLSLADNLAGLNFGYLDATRAEGIALLLILGLLGLFFLHAWKYGKRATVCVLLSVAMLVCSLPYLPTSGQVKIELAAADPSCVVVVQNRAAAVVALGGYRTGTARELLSKNNVKTVELLCFPSRSREVREAAAAVIAHYPVETAAVPQGQRVPKELKSADSVIFPADGESLSVLDGVTLTFDGEMQVVLVSYGGTVVAVEGEDGEAGAYRAPVLITANPKSDVNSPFTICLNDDIIISQTTKNHTIKNLDSAGGQVIVPQGSGMSILLTVEGSIEFRGESVWLGTNQK